jgi:PAS domain S-box-containing protein
MIKILAIDDNNDNLVSLKAILTDLFPDVAVLTAQSGQKGLELAVAENPDVILLDIVMPGLDGFDVCRRLKKNERVWDIPVVFLTALKGDQESRIKALEAGAEGFLAKPIDETELTAQIRAMVKIKQANEQKQDEKITLQRMVAERTAALENELNERKRTEKLLHESEYFFKETQEAAFIGSYKFDILKDHWTTSEILNQIFGIDNSYPRSFKDWQQLIHPDDQEMMSGYFMDEVFAQKKPFNKEYRIVRRSDQEIRWVLGLGRLHTDEEGNIISMMGTIQDITEIVLAKNAILRNEQKYRRLFESNSDSIAIFLINEADSTVSFVDCNENNVRLLGYSKEELMRQNPVQIEFDLTPDQIEWRKSELLKNGTVAFETKLRHKTGIAIDVEIKAVLINYNDQPAIMNITSDITRRKHQEESLKQSNELNRSLIQTIPFGINIVDETGNILFMNDTLKKFATTRVPSQKCWEFYRDDKTQCPDCPLVMGITIGKTELYESSGVLGGRIFQISHTGMMFQGKKAMLEIFQDITEKKEIDKKVKLLAHSLESINECVSVTDNQDTIIYVNQSFVNTYGFSKEELIGQNTNILRAPENTHPHARDILPLTKEGGWKGELINRKKDGTQFPISLSTSVIKDDEDNPVALIGVATDITETRRSRNELIAARDRAEENNRLKTAFLNNMSHEIRTPMNHIMGFSSLMSEAECSEKDAFAAIIQNSSNQLLSLIENVILLSRLQSERPAVNNQVMGTKEFVSNLGEIFRSECMLKNLELQYRIPDLYQDLTIQADAEKLRQIMVNLISNAVKYTDSGSITIGFNVLEAKHSAIEARHALSQLHTTASKHALSLHEPYLQFFVKDTGFGIQTAEQSQIFDSFYRTEKAMSLAIGGTGLGLSIVKELVKSVNGTIHVESEPGNGSTFYFTIPLVSTESSPESAKPNFIFQPKMEDMVLLIADDEHMNFLYLEILLKNLVKRIDHASNGRQALEMVSKQHYDLIFMDLKMPEVNGYDATKIIKQQQPEVTIIAQTAYSSPEDEEKALMAGCDDFISKPIKKSLLLEKLQKYSS